jgi:hypothetical protein
MGTRSSGVFSSFYNYVKRGILSKNWAGGSVSVSNLALE